MTLGHLDTAIVVAYLVGMLAVGYYVSGRVRGFRDYFVAGGRMTTPVLACTLVSTYYGLDVTFGTSETAFHEGFAAFFAYSAPFYICYVASALFVAPRVRRIAALSLPEAMGHFYGRPGRAAAAAASFLYSAPILAVAGMGLIGEVFFGIPRPTAVVLGAAIALAYTIMGGLWADAMTDTVQFVVMCVAVAVGAALAMIQLGPPAALGERLGPQVLEPFGSLGAGEIWVFALAALTPLVEPAFYQRTFAARSGRHIVRALLIGAVLWVAYDWLVVYLGVAGQDLVASGRLPADLDSSAILLHVANDVLPIGLLGLFVAGCLAAAMSTVDSYTLIAAGNVVYDAWPALGGRMGSDKQLLLWTRLLTIVVLAISIFLALRFDRLRDAWIFMATILNSTVLIPMMVALFLPRLARPRAGAWSAILGLAASLAFFVLFESIGYDLPEDETRALDVPLLGGTWQMTREATMLVTLPLAALGFLLGLLTSRNAALPQREGTTS